MYINDQNVEFCYFYVMHQVTEEIGSYFPNGWIRTGRSYTFIQSYDKNFSTILKKILKCRNFSWVCSLASPEQPIFRMRGLSSVIVIPNIIAVKERLSPSFWR